MNYILNNIYSIIIIISSISIFIYLFIGLRFYYYIKIQNLKLPNNINPVIDCLCVGIFDLDRFYPDGVISIAFTALPCRVSIYDDIIEINYTKKITLNFHEVDELLLDKKKPPSGQRMISEWLRLTIIHNKKDISKKIVLYTDRNYIEFKKLKEIVDNTNKSPL